MKCLDQPLGLVTREYTLAPDVDGIRQARGHVREALAALTDPETLGRIELVVSELVTNCVRHGRGRPIKLWLAADESGDIAGEVDDQGSGVVAMREQGSTSVGGLGLLLVDALASAWGVYPGTTNVWFRFEAPA